MCTKVGFFTEEQIEAEVLKYIIASFPYIVKYKGTQTGIEYAVNAILKAEHIVDDFSSPIVRVVNKSDDSTLNDYTVYIYTTITIYNRVALREVLKYVLPCGYNYVLNTYASTDPQYSFYDVADEIHIYKLNSDATSNVRTPLTMSPEEYKYAGVVGFGVIDNNPPEDNTKAPYTPDVIQIYPKAQEGVNET